MGFIRAALSAGLNSFNDSKFKEAIVLPDNVSGDALAVKGQLLTKDPDGRSRHSNQKYWTLVGWQCGYRSPRLYRCFGKQRYLPW